MLAEVRMQGSSSRLQSLGGMARANLPSVATLVAVTLVYQLVGWLFGWATSWVFGQVWFDGLKLMALVGLAALATQPFIFGLLGMAFLLEINKLEPLAQWMAKGGPTAWVLTSGQMGIGLAVSLCLFSQPDLFGSGLVTWELATLGGWAYVLFHE